MERRLAPLLALALLSASPFVAGCIEYTDRVTCSNGTILDDDDECVAPPAPDGGVEVSTCPELCALATGFDATQLGCVTDLLEMAGPPPPECEGDLSVESSCSACVDAVGVPDNLCAVAGNSCQ